MNLFREKFIDFPLDWAYTKSTLSRSAFSIEKNLWDKPAEARALNRVPLFLFAKGEKNKMDSGLLRKIEKAKRYAEERDRIRIEKLQVTFDGDNNPHVVHFEDGAWHCDCDFFQTRQRCSHTMALEIIFEGMILELAPTES